MPIAVACPCGKRYKVPDAAAGKKFRCKECGEAVAVPKPSTNPGPGTARSSGGAARRPVAGAPSKRPASATPNRPKRRPPPQEDYEDDFADYDSGPPARKSQAATPNRPKKRPPQNDDYDDFSDDYEDDEYGSPARSKKSSTGALPPRRGSKSAAGKRRPPKPDADDKPRRKKSKSGLPDPNKDDDDETSPLGSILWGVIIIAVGIGSYFALGSWEQEGGSMRMNRLVLLVYELLGKTGVLVVFCGIGLVLVIMGVAKLVNRN